MRYFTEKPDESRDHRLFCEKVSHPLYNSCRLLKTDKYTGLAIVQKRFNSKLKVFFYNAPDSWVMDEILKNPNFADYVFEHADKCTNALYPTVTVRQVMYALKMKPLKKEDWETQEKQLL